MFKQKSFHYHSCVTATAIALALLWTQPAQAVDALIDTGSLEPNADTSDYDLSSDGSVAVGNGTVGAFYHAFRWEDGVMTDLGTLGGQRSNAFGVSGDGSIVVGGAQNAGGQWRAFRWENGVMSDLGTLGGTASYAYAISNDGSVIAGYAQNAGAQNRAFRWEGGVMTDLGTLGGNNAHGRGISGNNAVIVGGAQNAGGQYRPYRWEGGVMTDLGSLGGTDGYAMAASHDGSVIVGDSALASGDYHSFRWEGGVMTDLGTLGGSESYVWAMSQDGSKIGGQSVTAAGDYHAYLWEDGVMHNFNDLVPDFAGVDYFSWVSGFSDDGEIIMSGGYNDAGKYRVYLVNMAVLAATTPEQIAQDLTTAAMPATQGQLALSSQIGNSLGVARNAGLYFPSVPTAPARVASIAPISANPADIEPAAGGSDAVFNMPNEHRHAIYATGTYGWGQGDNDFSSTAASLNSGVLVKTTENTTLGAGIIGARSTTATAFDGDSRVTAKGITLLGAYAPPQGFSLYGSAAFAALDAKTDRRYFNGVSVDSSRGETDGTAFGASLRAGYGHTLNDRTSVMPYAEAEATHTRLDGYTETGGAFPATVGKQTGTALVSRLGAEISHSMTDQLTLRSRAAWGHRYGDPDDITATAATVTVALPPDAGDRNWAEGGVSATWQTDSAALLSADVAGRSGETSTPALSLTAGVVLPF